MSKLASILSSILLVTFFFSCSPQQGGLQKTSDRVSELVINNLVANRWCQLNSTTKVIDYTWTFTGDFKAFSIDVNAGVLRFDWSITNDNVLSFYVPESTNTLLFQKNVSYNYDVTAHKRTMRWIDSGAQPTCDSQGVCSIPSSDVTNFVECE